MRRLGFGPKAAKQPQNGTADLQTQMESLLDSVWRAEKGWRLMDRIDLAVAVERQRRP
jgi:hypothetical protein